MIDDKILFQKSKSDLDLIIITEFCDERINSTGFYWQQITKSLNEDFNISIVSPNVHPDFLNNGCEVRKIPKMRLLSRLMPAQLHAFLRMLLPVIRAPIRNSTVLVGTNPLFMPLVLPIIKILGAKKIVLLCYDLFPINLLSQTKSLFIKSSLYLISKIFLSFYKLCDEIIVCGRDMQELLIDRVPSLKERVSYVPNWGDSKDKLKKTNLKDSGTKLKLLFFGNLGRFQAINSILYQIEKVKSNDIEFIFAGSGDYAQIVETYSKKDKRVVFLGEVPMNLRNEIFQSSHISIVSVALGMKGTCVPSKSYFSLANKHPLLCFIEKGSEIDLLCSEFNCGWTIDLNDEHSLSNWVKKLSKSSLQNKKLNVEKIPAGLIDGTTSINSIKNILM
jgi:glycosyltransferase involved in cell wall biosynthesis